ncbi:MAG: hypothetical protein ACRC5A_07675 [Enterobacteriaceae bacterium]
MKINTFIATLVTTLGLLIAAAAYASPAQCMREWIYYHQQQLNDNKVSTFTGQTSPGFWGYRVHANSVQGIYPFGYTELDPWTNLEYHFTPFGQEVDNEISHCHCTDMWNTTTTPSGSVLTEVSGLCSNLG